MIRVLLVDDQAVVRRGLRTIVSSAADLEVVGEAEDGAGALALLERREADVVVLDVRMPRMDGIETTRRIGALPADRRPAVLILTTFDLDDYVLGALRAGAAGFLLKDAEPERLLEAIRLVADGQGLVAPAVTRRLIEELGRGGSPDARQAELLETLTEREHEVLVCLARGMSNAEAADALHLEESTVKTHVGRVLGKLNLRSRSQAVVLAYEAGVVRPGEDAAGRV